MSLEVNQQIAQKLVQAADILERQGANPYRVAAYRKGAKTLLEQVEPGSEILASGGLKALDQLPHIGEGIARAIQEMVTTGRWAQLDRLQGSLKPEDLFRTVPGVGPELAKRIL